jgi:hypothetical protein
MITRSFRPSLAHMLKAGDTKISDIQATLEHNSLTIMCRE